MPRSFWEKVSKSIYTTCSAQYHESYRYSLITWPLCDSTNQNFIQAKGGLYSHISSGEPLKSEYSFSVPVFIDGIETNIPCSISWIESDIWGYKCFISGGNKIKFFDTLITHSKTKIWIRISWEVKLVNCQNPDKLIRFVNVTPKCTTVNTKKTLLVDFSAHVFGFYEKENFILPLEDPSYAYLECTIPKSPISSAEKLINCILDINKFPLYSNRKITLPSNFPDINCEVTHWQNINKLQNIGVCYPSFYGDITPQIIHDPICAKEDYNILVFSSTIGFSSSQNYFSFDLNVLIDGKNSVMPCELFTSYFYIDTYFPMFCYNKGNGILSFFETTVTIENKYTPLFNISLDKKINLDICSVTEKIIFFENVNTICSVVNNNQYFVNVQLYAKINGFPSNYSFILYLDSPSSYYMSCTIPSSKSNIKELTYIECKLDILKFPLINPTSINLPSQLPLKDINIINWDKMIKVHDCSKCNPKYSLKFSPKEYIETSCYKPHYNKISVKGQIAQKGNDYSFEMNAFVDGQITLLPCELKSLGENSNDYQLDCITNGNSVSIYNTFARDVYSKELIYIQGSHTFTIKECIPTKFITFKTIETECSIADKLFKIFFYADIKGFSNEVKITVYLEKPTYAYMTCTIPKTGGSDQYIYCTIDVNRYPLKSMNEITLPSEFYIHPEC